MRRPDEERQRRASEREQDEHKCDPARIPIVIPGHPATKEDATRRRGDAEEVAASRKRCSDFESREARCHRLGRLPSHRVFDSMLAADDSGESDCTSASPHLRVKTTEIASSIEDFRKPKARRLRGFPLARATPARTGRHAREVSWLAALSPCPPSRLPSGLCAGPCPPADRGSPPTVAGAARVSNPIPFAVAFGCLRTAPWHAQALAPSRRARRTSSPHPPTRGRDREVA